MQADLQGCQGGGGPKQGLLALLSNGGLQGFLWQQRNSPAQLLAGCTIQQVPLASKGRRGIYPADLAPLHIKNGVVVRHPVGSRSRAAGSEATC